MVLLQQIWRVPDPYSYSLPLFRCNRTVAVVFGYDSRTYQWVYAVGRAQ